VYGCQRCSRSKASSSSGVVRGMAGSQAFAGTDLSNHVQWVGLEEPDGTFLRIPTCAAWREALADGRYSHVVTMYDPYDPAPLTTRALAVTLTLLAGGLAMVIALLTVSSQAVKAALMNPVNSLRNE
jgi:hypothetical protein